MPDSPQATSRAFSSCLPVNVRRRLGAVAPSPKTPCDAYAPHDMRSRASSRPRRPQLERAELARLTGDKASREQALREAYRLFVEIGATARAEPVAREIP